MDLNGHGPSSSCVKCHLLIRSIMMALSQDSPALKIQLDLLHNESNLWTNYGLRSLATTRLYPDLFQHLQGISMMNFSFATPCELVGLFYFIFDIALSEIFA